MMRNRGRLKCDNVREHDRVLVMVLMGTRLGQEQ
jgi:hypothetical protein